MPMDWLVVRLDESVVPNRLIATNRAAMPIDLRVSLDHAVNIRTAPAFPMRATIPPLASVPVATVGPARRGSHWGYSYATTWGMGAPGETPVPFTYEVPLLGPAKRARVVQGPGGAFSHTDRFNRYAIDYGVPVGTPVAAARAGTVATIEQGFTEAGTDPSFAKKGNSIRILHDDGTWSYYGHLEPRSARVRIGDHVEAGQVLALSGNTGWSSGPHLHFAVMANRDDLETSIPFTVARN